MLCRMNRQRHRQAAAEQHEGVDRAKQLDQVRASFGERFGVLESVEQIRKEQPAEEQDFLGEERPHPQLDGVVLLLDVVEMMCNQPAAVSGAVIFRGHRIRGDVVCCYISQRAPQYARNRKPRVSPPASHRS
jgi:hypothetical protein